MDNVLIEINKKTRQVFLTNSVIGNDGENLQEKLVFSFNDEFVNGTARLELIKPDKTKSYIMLTKVNESYEIPVKSIITKGGRLTMQLVITQGTDPNAIPIFKSNTFYVVVGSSINFLIEEPDEYPQWIDVANEKLNEIDSAILETSNLDIDANKEDGVTTITLTDKEGQTKEVQILDGQDGEQGPQGIQGPVGPAGADGKDGKDGTDGQDGQDATINGVNTLTIEAGDNITINQTGSTMTISSQGGGEVTSVNGQTGDVVINVPDVSNFITKDVNDLTYYELKTAVGNSITMSIDSSTYVLTVSLKNSAGTVLNTQTVDLPLETMVVGGSYDSTNKKIILTLKNGQTIEFSVADLVSGLQSEITSSNKLSADLVDDTNTTNKFVSASDKTTWDGKYTKPIAGIPSTDLAEAVQTSLGKADTALQSETYTGTITSVKMNGSTVASSGEADLGTVLTQHQDISGKQDIIQYSTMPTASADLVGKIVQYVGTTTTTTPIYTNGYFYKCVSDEEPTPTYSWEIATIQPMITTSLTSALLNCFQNVAWANDDGQTYYDELESALNEVLGISSISAVYTQSGAVYDDQALNDLKQDLVVYVNLADGSIKTTTDYTLSGTLTAGTSTITVNYFGYSTTFTVNVIGGLPNTYTKYDYITFEEGNTWTGEAVSVPDGLIRLKTYTDLDAISFETDFSYNLGQIYSAGTCLFAGRSVPGTTHSLGIFMPNGKIAMHYQGIDTGQTSLSFNLNTKYHLSYNYTGTSPSTLTLDNNSISLPYTEHVEIPNTKLTLFSNPNATDTESYPANKHRIGRLKIYDVNGVVISDYVPCQRKADNVSGMFDLVDQVFYTCATTSLATQGSSRYVYKVGNWS